MTERVTVTPRVVDAQEFAAIISLVQLGRVPEAWARFQSASLGDGALARFGGAVNYALANVDPAPSCPGGTTYLAHPWGDSRRVELPTFGEAPVVVTLAVPDDAPTSRTLGTIRLYEYRGDPADKQLTIGRHACDFRDALDPAGETGPMINVGGKSATVGFGVSFGGSEDALLQAGGTYYISMRALVAGTWPAAYEIQWPR